VGSRPSARRGTLAGMTTEDDFQAALDANPADWQTRLVFADWLDERSDVRAEGYRALGQLRKCPSRRVGEKDPRLGEKEWFIGSEDALNFGPRRDERYVRAQFPPDWWSLVECGEPWGHGAGPDAWLFFATRRETEDAAALAFAELPPERRTELLATIPKKKTGARKKPQKPPAKKSKGKKK
jgi:uncharacterized protein (TIGR02996 family)